MDSGARGILGDTGPTGRLRSRLVAVRKSLLLLLRGTCESDRGAKFLPGSRGRPGENSRPRGAEIRGGERRPEKFLDRAYTTGSLLEDMGNYAFFHGTPTDLSAVRNRGELDIFFPGSPDGGVLLMPRLYKNVDCSAKRTLFCGASETMTFEEASRYCADVPAVCNGGYLHDPGTRDFFTRNSNAYCMKSTGDVLQWDQGVTRHSGYLDAISRRSRELEDHLQGAYPTGSLFEDPWNFAFFDGTPSDYQQVAGGPMSSSNPGNGIILIPVLWKNVDCSVKRNFFCYQYYSGVICGCNIEEGWIFSWGFCFIRGPEPMTYEDAVQHCPTVPGGCEGAYGTFLSPNHYVRDAFINYMRLDSQDDDNGDHPGRYWMGLRRNPESGQWETPSGTPFNATTEWHWDGYPTEDGGDCASLFVSSWIPTFVGNLYGFVCKKASLA
ncbi:unnamed protein product [Darwinula stevensoni]|uniref:C-type lectin domain-containing protein n=1 Tax=Darwinula stevensoni TaxID=69355 RepID=A0A7R9A8G4_9CRUS|nr:unnamed protein product [Darwinula stevensoni]CAG0896415.1 unnamed protein product [Darwinula stevensoni]